MIIIIAAHLLTSIISLSLAATTTTTPPPSRTGHASASCLSAILDTRTAAPPSQRPPLTSCTTCPLSLAASDHETSSARSEYFFPRAIALSVRTLPPTFTPTLSSPKQHPPHPPTTDFNGAPPTHNYNPPHSR
ncbi:unnamed protein product [Zymoseptoria tritici ST99CH_1E4]|uniref:Uncharacterized protein n=1 Tax=Zymoseptoria tritici ST99CH_1E4 TaxID=1276532 RepID=A0A2H1GSY4_ZYMTR|nr:unnamed protein product [Zymoseptoria tritici ST99CH_1E4]